jgi:LmbE family N-acetylglucosaminyl deacetylase
MWMADTPTDPPRHVVLSPHLDDAAFSAWHVLSSGAEVLVVTVFAGVPAPGFVTALDAARGGNESAPVVRRRREDDRAALAARTPVHLDLLDVDYRAFALPELRAAIERNPDRFIALVGAEPALRVEPEELERHVKGLLAERDVVHVPAGIGGHPDHRDVGRLGARLAALGRTVRLYADIPYLFRRGRPSWLGGEPGSHADSDAMTALAALADPTALTREIVEFEAAQVSAKVTALRRYETEFDLINDDFGGVLDDMERMRYEVSWAMPTAGGSCPRS